MRLYEFEGKALFRQFGIPVPAGRVLDGTAIPGAAPWPAVLKAQLLAGGRGKAGLVRAVSTPEEARAAAAELLPAADRAAAGSGAPARGVLLEERVAVRRELYAAVYLDRQARAPAFMVSPRGGVDVEALPDAAVVRVPVNPLVGLQPCHLRAAVAALAGSPAEREALMPALEGLHRLFVAMECELVEVNPLAVTDDGRAVALDAKVVLDERVAARHPEYAGERSGRTPFESAARAAGAAGVEIDPAGDIAVVTAGAGAMMSTCDCIRARGGRLRAVLDFGGFAWPAEEYGRAMGLIHMVRPRRVVFNFFTQLLSCEVLARAIVLAMAGAPDVRALVRMKGLDAAEGTRILREAGIAVTDALPAVCDWAVANPAAMAEPAASGQAPAGGG